MRSDDTVTSKAPQPDDQAQAEVYRQRLEESPDDVVAWYGLGIAYWFQNRFDDAVAALRTAIELRPEYAEAMNDLGVMLGAGPHLDEALAAFRDAAVHRPTWAQPWINKGNLLRNHGRFEESLDAYREAITRQPTNADAHHLLGSALGRHGLREASCAHYREALRLDPTDVVVHSSLLYLSGFEPNVEPAVTLNEHVWWDRLHGRGMTPRPPHPNDRSPDRRLRIGYVSPDFRTHPVARFMLPVYEAHDREQVQVYSYARIERPDAISERLRVLSDGWRPTAGVSDLGIAEMVRADEIDILVDLGGHTGGNCLVAFSRQPAPIQVSYLGYPHTTGLEAMQYRLTDAINDPLNEESRYIEALVRLPGPWFCWEPQPSPDVSDAPCARHGFITFGSMHNLLKINDGVIDLWAQVMRAIPDSRLHIYRNTMIGVTRDHLRRRFIERGITPDRVDLNVTAHDGTGHLNDYAKVDVSLDTQPWTGHATTCESLWMGVPMLTQRGTRASGRMSAAILEAVGLRDFIADTPAELVDIAASHARDPRRLVELRRSLRERVRRSDLCDGRTFTRGLELAYRDMWRRWCKSGE